MQGKVDPGSGGHVVRVREDGAQSVFQRGKRTIQQFAHLGAVGTTTGHVAFLQRRQVDNLTTRAGHADDCLRELQNRELDVGTDVRDIIHEEVIIKAIGRGIEMVFDIAERSRLFAVTIDGNVPVLEGSADEFRNDEIGALLRAVRIEQAEDREVEIVFPFERTQIRLSDILYDGVRQS